MAKQQTHYWAGGLSTTTACSRTITMGGVEGVVSVEQVRRSAADIDCPTCHQMLRWQPLVPTGGTRASC